MTKRIAVMLAVILVIIQLGCSAGSRMRPIGLSGRLPTRDTLVRDRNPFPYYGAYGYLVFTARPSASELSRYIEVCNEYKLNVEPVGEYAYELPYMLMVTFWLLEEPANGDQTDCEELVAKYDYATAERIASAVGKLDAAGPLLVAWDRPFGSSEARYPPLVFDLSNFSEEDLRRSLRIWYERICRLPQAWNKGWRLSVFREEFRSLLQRYGGKIIEIVS